MSFHPAEAIEEVIAASAVRIRCNGRPVGSGFFILPNVIVTAGHVISSRTFEVERVDGSPVSIDAPEVEIFADRVVFADMSPLPDLAVIPLNSVTGPAVPVAKHPPQVGTIGYIAGYPTQGGSNVFDLERCQIGTRTGDRGELIKFTAGIVRPGFSGSMLIDVSQAAVCGVVLHSRNPAADVGGFAVPILELGNYWDRWRELPQADSSARRWRTVLTGLAQARNTPTGESQIRMRGVGTIPEALHPVLERSNAELRAPVQIPSPPADFLGREAELAALSAAAIGVEGDGHSHVIVIEGPAGSGKSTLSSFWASQIIGKYDGGSFYLDLNGFAPTGKPLEPYLALGQLLRSLGTPPERMVGDIAARSDLLRNALANEPTFILLDNAYSYDQIRPLLPVSGPSTVCVTSRNSLPETRIYHDAKRLSLGGLPVEDARQLLRVILGEDIDADRSSRERFSELIAACEGMPLALRIAAERLKAMPRGQWADALEELLSPRSPRLDLLSVPGAGAQASMRSVISWSVDRLSPSLRDGLKEFALFPGRRLSIEPVSALRASHPFQVRTELAALTNANLLRNSGDFFAFYDMVRLYAVSDASQAEDPRDKLIALAGWYAQTCVAADKLLASYRAPIRLTSPTIEPVVSFDSRDEALAWYEHERDNILEVVRSAYSIENYEHVYQIATAAWGFYELTKLRDDWRETHELALASALKLNNLPYECRVRDNLGIVYWEIGDLANAEECLLEVIPKWRSLDDDYGEAASLDSLSLVVSGYGDYARALELLQAALVLNKRVDDRWGQGRVLTHQGIVNLRLGENEAARRVLVDAVGLYEQLGDLVASSRSGSILAHAVLRLRQAEEATSCLRRALEIQESERDLVGLARTLTTLALVDIRESRRDQALSNIRRAIELYERLGEVARSDLLGNVLSDFSGPVVEPDVYHQAEAALDLLLLQ